MKSLVSSLFLVCLVCCTTSEEFRTPKPRSRVSANPQCESDISITDVEATKQTVKDGAVLLGDSKETYKYCYSKRIDVAGTNPKLAIQIWEKRPGAPIWDSDGPYWSPIVVVTLDDKRVSALLLDGVALMTDLWAAFDNDRVFLYVDSRRPSQPAGVYIYEMPVKSGKIKAAGLYLSRERLADYSKRNRAFLGNAKPTNTTELPSLDKLAPPPKYNAPANVQTPTQKSKDACR